MTIKTEKKKKLTRKRERELIALYQQTQNNEYMNELIEAHAAYIQKIAYIQYQKFGKLVDIDDLVQEGKIGLIKAIKNFQLDRTSINPNTNKVVTSQALLTYAHNKILSEMQNLYHKSTAAHVPAHILRSLSFNIENPKKNAEKYKILAKNSIRSESLDYLDTNTEFDNFSFKENKILNALIRKGKFDPTFDESIINVFSPKLQNAIKKLNTLEWKILQLKLGLNKGEEFLITKNNVIASELNMNIEEVDKIYKIAKRKLVKYLIEDNNGKS